MPGIGQAPVQPISAGLSAQPLVTSASDVVTPDAVAQLTDAFHKGFITADDVIQRVGSVGQAQRKALLEQLGEYVSPDVIKSRMAAANAVTAQSQLAQQGATAAQGLIQPATALSALQTQKQTAETIQGPTGLSAVQTYGKWFGKSMDDFKDPKTGKYDFNAAANEGNNMASQMNLADTWLLRLQPEKTRPVKTATGSYDQQLNHWNVDVTPPGQQTDGTWFPGAQAYQAYVKELGTYLPKYHPAWKQFMTTSKGMHENGDPGNSSPVAPSDDTTPIPDASSVIQPGIQTAPAPGTLPPEVRAELKTDPQYQYWSQKIGSMRDFALAAQRVYEPPAPEDSKLGINTMNEKDFALMNALRQLAVPVTSASAGGGRGTPDLQGAKIEENLPILERLSDWKQVVARTGSLTEGTRRRLIQLGNDYISTKEASVAPRLQWAVDTSKNSPGQLWGANSDEANLLNGKSLVYKPAQSDAAAPAAGTKRTVNIPGVGPVTVNY